MGEEVGSIVRGLTGLMVVAAASLWLTVSRFEREAAPPERRRLQILVGLVIVVQTTHFIEELIAGFHMRFPELLGLAPWPFGFFVGFNLFWIAVWGLSALVVGRRIRGALFPIWFLAVGSALNGIAHPTMALMDAGYFPGLLTSPVCGIAGVMLLRSLTAYTVGRSPLRGT